MDSHSEPAVQMSMQCPQHMWPLYERELREYLTRAMQGHCPEISIHQAEGNCLARRRSGWTEHCIRLPEFTDMEAFQLGDLDIVWAMVIVEMAKNLQSHDALEIVCVHRYEKGVPSILGKPPTIMTQFLVVYDLPPKRREKPYGSASSSSSGMEIDVTSSPDSPDDWIARDLNRGDEYKRKRTTTMVIDD